MARGRDICEGRSSEAGGWRTASCAKGALGQSADASRSAPRGQARLPSRPSLPSLNDTTTRWASLTSLAAAAHEQRQTSVPFPFPSRSPTKTVTDAHAPLARSQAESSPLLRPTAAEPSQADAHSLSVPFPLSPPSPPATPTDPPPARLPNRRPTTPEPEPDRSQPTAEELALYAQTLRRAESSVPPSSLACLLFLAWLTCPASPVRPASS